MADAIPAPAARAGARGGGAHWWLWWFGLLGPAPVLGDALQLLQEPTLRSPNLEGVRFYRDKIF